MAVVKYTITKEITIQKERSTYTFIPSYIVDQVQKEKNNFLHLVIQLAGSSKRITLVFSKIDLDRNLISEGRKFENKNYPSIGNPTFSYFKLQLLPDNFFQEISSLLSLKRRYLPLLKKGNEDCSEHIDDILNLINKRDESSKS